MRRDCLDPIRKQTLPFPNSISCPIQIWGLLKFERNVELNSLNYFKEIILIKKHKIFS